MSETRERLEVPVRVVDEAQLERLEQCAADLAEIAGALLAAVASARARREEPTG